MPLQLNSVITTISDILPQRHQHNISKYNVNTITTQHSCIDTIELSQQNKQYGVVSIWRWMYMAVLHLSSNQQEIAFIRPLIANRLNKR